MRVLIVTGKEEWDDTLKRALTVYGYAADLARDGQDAALLARTIPYDLIVVSFVFPDENGPGVCRVLRQSNISSPILILLSQAHHMAAALDSGADDCLVEPFLLEELAARARVLLNKETRNGAKMLSAGDLRLDLIAREVTKGARVINLNAKEFAILEYLMRNPGMVLTHTMIEQHCWDMTLDTGSNVVEAHIWRLRKALGRDGEATIETVRGAGYKLKVKKD